MGLLILRRTFKNDAIMTGVYRMYSYILSKVVSQSYGQKWYMSHTEELCKDVLAFKHKIVKTFLPVCKFGLFTINFDVWTIWEK